MGAIDLFKDNGEIIRLRSGDSAVPYRFYFKPAPSVTGKGAIPFGTTVSSVVVTAHADDSADTDATTEMIQGTPSVSSNTVLVKLNYPTSTAGTPWHHLSFLVTASDNSKKRIDYNRVIVGDES